MNAILTQEITFAKQDILRGFRKIDKKAEIHISQLIYYPYYFFEFEVNAKSLLKFRGKVGCTIDALSGKGAIVDVQPEFSNHQIEVEPIPPVVFSEDDAKKIAEKFVFDHASSKAKFVTIPKIRLLSSALFHRPFWLAEYSQGGYDQRQMIFDAISGSYHPL
ncbi:hypothetical protein [Sporosarcina sp. JAI121]|uniref:hypothetical protein n=1 Tax=Sporosarcina sp. JAI121 TaxID=2723064 RepID=UPI0015C730B8|nr:hypothetical protein [Sporosarcina sp. JAI121]NYF23273.1 hypothetical protein [Sporosarcina sp. JAI121]